MCFQKLIRAALHNVFQKTLPVIFLLRDHIIAVDMEGQEGLIIIFTIIDHCGRAEILNRGKI
ncbi:hypothetical protein SDC9_140051 [bioreactor metagenome]|uniref:Uncharacterized protein n=1 Tax=bioreactor metagenome TaxID=1076179 RepID=A0A645DUF9_9ZZZZ